MSRIAYVNGSYVPLAHACVHIEDRGYQFADGVYEGITVYKGTLIDLEPHLDRLWHSLGGLRIGAPMDKKPLSMVIKEVVRRNRIKNGFVYLQITRGVASRDHPFPKFAIPSLVITCKPLSLELIAERARKGIALSSQADIRWGRCDIKSISLLPNILAKQAAREEGAFEAMLIDDEGFVTEGSSTNIWMVSQSGEIITRSTHDNILPGITRQAIRALCDAYKLEVVERAFTVEEAGKAAEMFLTSSTVGAMPVVMLDGYPIGNGEPGPVARRLLDLYHAHMETQVLQMK